MPWLQIRIATLPEHTEQLEDALLLFGCVAVTLLDTEDKPVFEPIRGTTPLWEHTTIQGLFDHSTDADTLRRSIEQLIAEDRITVGTINIDIVEDKDWQRSWMDDFHPIQCGTRLWIVPTWQDSPDPTAVNLKLDPGLAFGTGTHPTTFLCLKWLDSHIEGGEQLLDYGCGSGILGIAALLLGASSMDGIDIDPQALTASQSNAQTNGIEPHRYHVTSDVSDLKTQYDTVLANILAGPLCDLAESISARVAEEGNLVLSGILSHQASDVVAAYEPWIEFKPLVELDGWVCLSGQKRRKTH